MEKILTLLHQDERLSEVLKRVPLRIPELQKDVYLQLVKSVVEQQLSTTVAAVIWKRFLALFEGYPHPELVLGMDADTLRSCGLSYRKGEYIQNVASFARDEKLALSILDAMSNNEAVLHLSQIKGVGKWTAEMILMFTVGREDVFPIDDLIIRNAMVKLYGLESEKKQLYRDLEEIATSWQPYRSYACFILWDWYEGEVLNRKLYGED